MSRRLLILQTQNEKGYFDGYKTSGNLTDNSSFCWFSFDNSNRFQIGRTNNGCWYRAFERSLANFNYEIVDVEPSSQLLPMGYDSNKKYNLRIRVLNKIINEGYNVEYFNGNGNFTFLFKGPEITKSSQSVSIRDLDQGTEFIIPVEIGEILNNLCVKYLPETIDGEGDDYYHCRILFEVYFEEITE